MRVLLPLVIMSCAWTPTWAQNSPWTGEWVSDFGLVTMDVDGGRLSGRYGDGGTITGTATDSAAEMTYKKGNVTGSLKLRMTDDGVSFTGRWQSRSSSGSCNGWKIDPSAANEEIADWSGVWLTDWGTLQITQNEDQVKGTMGAKGWADLSGSVRGRRLELTWNRIKRTGKAWLVQTSDGKRLYGMSTGEKPSTWIGVRLEGYENNVAPKAGETVKGYAKNGMLYHLRMPNDWKPGDNVDTIVLLHGSNWTTAGMVRFTAETWPEIGKNFAILGIQGQKWAKWSNNDDLRFNYSYINWMGRSTYRGYPNTDRESPYLVMNVIRELKKKLVCGRVFVGGHSQGGFLTYLLHMHFPEEIDGTFPVSGGLVIQSDPAAFDDEKLISFQKETPMAIVHGKEDRVVRFSTGIYAHNRLIGNGFSKVKLISPTGGHAYDFLPINEAIEYLDMMTTDDPKALTEYAMSQLKLENWREVGLAIERANVIGAQKLFSPIQMKYEMEAMKQADKQTKAIMKKIGNLWVDEFIDWTDQFGKSDAASEAMIAWESLGAQQKEPAAKAMKAARKAFNENETERGFELYEEIAEKYFAAPVYRQVRESLKNR